MNAEVVRKRLRKASDQCGGQRALARMLGVSSTYLNDVIVGRKEPAGKLLDALGLQRVVRYEKV